MAISTTVTGRAWVHTGSDHLDDYWLGGQPAEIEVNYEDGQVRVGTTPAGMHTEAAGFYFNTDAAVKLAALILAEAV